MTWNSNDQAPARPGSTPAAPSWVPWLLIVCVLAAAVAMAWGIR